MEPPPVFAIAAAASLVPRNTLVAFTASSLCQPSSPSASPTELPLMPALFTRMSSLPYAAIVSAISFFQSASDVTSVRTKRACRWLAEMSAATASPSFTSMSAMTTLAPSCANSRASASPMPWAPPVMIATLSLSRMMSSPSASGRDHPMAMRGVQTGQPTRCGRTAQAVVDREPEASFGNRHHRDPRQARATSASASNCRRPANSRAAASVRSAVSLKPNTAPAPGNGGPKASSASSRAHPPHRAAPAASAHSARRAGPAIAARLTCSVSPCSHWSDDRLDRLNRRAARPQQHGTRRTDRARWIPRPPDKARCRARRRCARTSRPRRAARVVGLTWPERFAEGAATGRPVSRSSASAVSCAGTRTASVSSPALASRLTSQPRRRGSTRVSGPGQNAAARRRACAFATTSANAASASG